MSAENRLQVIDLHSHWSTRRGYPLQTEAELAQQESTLVGADLATSITNLTQATVATNAILSASGQILSTLNLLNFLK